MGKKFSIRLVMLHRVLEKKIKKNFEFEVKSPKLDTILRFNKVNGKRQGIAIEFNKKTYYYSEFIYENNIKQGDIKI